MDITKIALKEYFPLLVISLVHIFLLNSYNPLSGMDVGYYSSRLIDLMLHFKEEGLLTTQWWTPSYGGGIPAFPSPLHYQYSITPYLVLFFSPWTSTVLTYIIFNILGYVLVINYVKKHLQMESSTAILAAVVFTTSGFWVCHSLAGHLSYHTFTLIAIVPYLLYSKWSNNRKIIIFSTAVIYMIHSGAYFPIYLTYLSLIQLLFLFMILVKVEIKNLVKVLSVSHMIIIGVSISKIIAVLYHMDVVPRLNSYSSWQPYIICFPLANLFQLFSWRFLYPIENLLPIPADSILFWVCGSRYEFWENDISISPVALPLILFGLYKFKKQIKVLLNRKRKYFILMLIVFWFSAEISIGKGIFWSLIKDLPMIKSTHVNVRYCGSIVLFLTILLSYFHFYIFRDINKRIKELFLYFALIISILSMFSYYFIIDEKDGFLSYDRSYEKNIWKDIKDGNSMTPISSIVHTNLLDHFSQYKANASSFMPNDPLYGYHGHSFISSLKVGPVEEIDKDGFYNFHNPLTFYDPKLAIIPRSKIHSNDHANLRLFINRKQPEWELPIIQIVANYMTLFSIFLFFLYILYTFLKKSKLTNS